jgi:carbon storage regulator
MLVLTRRLDEKIMIGDDISVQIVSISGETVRIGIDAPQKLRILREEVYDLVKSENAAASTASRTAPSSSITALANRLRKN